VELNFTFTRPTRFLDMEGGTSVFAEPSEIADRYQQALQEYLAEPAEDRDGNGRRLSPRQHRRAVSGRVDAILDPSCDGAESAMSFLQPWMLIALPLAAIPIIIHLINQRRYQTKQWAAMMFLLSANRMTRGYARVRQWLILLLRALAIAALVIAIGRPLASGSLGSGIIGSVAGNGAANTIVLLDRSPSMQERDGSGTLIETWKRAWLN
jgi:hypothetical protein